MKKSAHDLSRRLLLVDDNLMFADLVAVIAKDHGFHAEVTSTVKDFQAAYLADKPALLGMDLVMPVTDGIELLSWLCDIGSDVPALVFSGKEAIYLKAAKTLAEARGSFEVETFGKPLDITALQVALRRFRDLRRSKSALGVTDPVGLGR